MNDTWRVRYTPTDANESLAATLDFTKMSQLLSMRVGELVADLNSGDIHELDIGRTGNTRTVTADGKVVFYAEFIG